jgi:hypothetical protein
MSGPLDSAKIPTASVVGGTYNVVAPAPVDGQSLSLQQDANGNLLVNVAVGGGSSGTVKIEDTTGASLLSNGSGALNVAVVSGGGSNASVGTIGAAAPTSATEIGVVDGSGNLQHITTNSTTFTSKFAADVNLLGTLGTAFTTAGFVDVKGADGNVFIRQATAANLNATVVGTGTFAVQEATLDAALIAQEATTSGVKGLTAFGAVTTAAPTYTTGKSDSLSLTTAGALRVDGSGVTQPVSLTSTTITGTVAVTQSTSPWVNNLTQVAGTSLGATAVTNFGSAPAAAAVPGVNASLFAGVTGITATGTSLNANITNTAGPFTVAQATAANLNATLVGTKTNNSAAPSANTNVGALGAIANASGPLWTEGNQVLESVDLNGGLRTMGSNIPQVTAAWTSATALNTVLQQTCIGYGTVLLTLNQGSTITGGTVAFEVSDTVAGTNWYSISGLSQFSLASATGVASTYTFVANTNASFQFSVAGWAAFRVRLSLALSGTATVNVGIQAVAQSPALSQVNVNNTTAPVNVRGTVNGASVADDLAQVNFFQSSGSTSNPLYTANSIYGGAFSGAANAALQGWSKMRTPTVFRTVSATASGNTAIWTPGSGNKFRLLKLFIQVTDNASLASGGVLTVDIQDSSTTTNITFSVFVPTTAVTTTIGDGAEIQLDLGQFGILSAAANNVLNVNLSSALATGVCRIIAMGTEE